MRMQLTNETVAALKPAAYRYDACDIGNPGFLVRVYPRGTKSYHYRYRIKDTVRMMLLGRSSYTHCAAAKKLYLEARKTRLGGEDPQGAPPVTREADQLLLELWYDYETTGKPPEIFSSAVTADDLAAKYGVTPAAVKKLVAYRYLGVKKTDEDQALIYPVHDAIRNMVDDGDRLERV